MYVIQFRSHSYDNWTTSSVRFGTLDEARAAFTKNRPDLAKSGVTATDYERIAEEYTVTRYKALKKGATNG